MVWPADLADRGVAVSILSIEVRIYIWQLTGIILWPWTQSCGVDRRRFLPRIIFFGISIRFVLIGWM